MADVMLVHGAFHAGSCWDLVGAALRSHGHRVWAPTLTGLGERAYLATKTTDLSAHVREVEELITFADLPSVVLVGHGYAGMILGVLHDRMPQRIRNLVYLDGFVPENGENALDGFSPLMRAKTHRAAAEHGHGWLVPPPPREVLVGPHAEASTWLRSHLRPQPLGTLTQPVRLLFPEVLDCSYVACTGWRSIAALSLERARSRGWRIREIPEPHSAMLTAPQTVTREIESAIEAARPMPAVLPPLSAERVHR
ncbi:alpha/beta hydrolase [Frankia sp. Cr1]|uniref:alpha/beta fold hydrolase n=1 Tax=Frankia sp. Cr1 TaxID=3073931 RepID=UPI002AD57112|nr:alpha/beta hydrolase [Frankia sp. Cr1]